MQQQQGLVPHSIHKKCRNTVQGKKKKKSLSTHSAEANLGVITGHAIMKNGNITLGCRRMCTRLTLHSPLSTTITLCAQ